MGFSARAATKGVARPWRRRPCTSPRHSSTLPPSNELVGNAFSAFSTARARSTGRRGRSATAQDALYATIGAWVDP